MNKVFLSLILIIVCSSLQAQTGAITGSVKNGQGTLLEAATLELLSHPGKSLVKAALSDKSGIYLFENIPAGVYTLKATATGYEKTVTDTIPVFQDVMTDKNIILTTKTKSLTGVTVTSIRPLIEQKIDRMIVNVDASPSNAGATALEVLEKSPGVTVDNDGNISLKGKAGVIVMMDGKPTYLSAADLANVLRNLPASSLDQIEIMTNPSSKYDAAGNSGIINIKTKKSKTKGSNGSVAIGNTTGIFDNIGNHELKWKPTFTLNYNYKKNKVNLFGNFVYNYREGGGKLDIVSRYSRDGKAIDSIDNVNTIFKGRNNNYTLKLGMDYAPDKKNTYGIVLNGFLFAGRPRSTTFTTYTDLEGNPFSKLNSTTTNKLSWTNGSGNFNYRHVFDTTGAELTLDLDYSNYHNISDQLLNTGFFDGNDIPTSDSMFLRGHLPSDINIYSLKSDFIKPLKSGIRVEGGIKSSYVTSDNLVNYERSVFSGWIPDSRNNHFIYTENINAVYLNGSKTIKKIQLQGGLRVENTNTEGKQVIDNSVVKRSYVSLFPTAFASFELNKKNSLTFSLSRRLQRPNYQDLNPFTFFLDSLSYRQGNPYLTPQFSWNYEITHSYNGKLITTVNYSKTTDVISNIINRKRGSNNEIIGFLTSDNIAGLNNWGISVSTPVKVRKWWNVNLYANVYRNHYKGTYISNETNEPVVVPLDIAFTSFTFNVNNNFTLGRGWSAEISGWYRYKTVEQLSLASPIGQMNFGLAKNNLLKGKMSLRLTARDPFNFQYWGALTKYGTVDITLKNHWDNRQYGVNLTYRFGTQQGQSRRRKAATEEEQNRVGAGGG